MRWSSLVCVVAAGLLGCSSDGDGSPSTESDAVAGDSTASDAGTDSAAVDTGATAFDTGAPVVDTGATTVDTGAPAVDSGTSSDAGGCGATVSFAKDIQPIFTASCASSSCHGGTAPKDNLNLTSGKAYAELVNVKATGTGCTTRTLVVPSNVASSYLMNKLTGVDICGAKMPKTGTISTANVDKIRTWICSGAKND